MVVGLIYGEKKQISGHYKRITSQYHFPVLDAQDFWHRLTGDSDFYQDLIKSIGSIAIESDYSKELEGIINKLSLQDEIQTISKLEEGGNID
jgi:hypothetical protein